MSLVISITSGGGGDTKREFASVVVAEDGTCCARWSPEEAFTIDGREDLNKSQMWSGNSDSDVDSVGVGERYLPDFVRRCAACTTGVSPSDCMRVMYESLS